MVHPSKTLLEVLYRNYYKTTCVQKYSGVFSLQKNPVGIESLGY